MRHPNFVTSFLVLGTSVVTAADALPRVVGPDLEWSAATLERFDAAWAHVKFVEGSGARLDPVAPARRGACGGCPGAGRPPVAVRARTLVSRNGREPRRLVDPATDLAATAGRLPEAWVLPLEVPLERQWSGADLSAPGSDF